MAEVGGSRRFHDKKQLTQMLHASEMRVQVLEMALRQIASQPSDDPAALQQLAKQGLQKAAEAETTTAVPA